MASQLSVKQKRQLCEHKTALQNDGKKMPYKDQLKSQVDAELTTAELVDLVVVRSLYLQQQALANPSAAAILLVTGMLAEVGVRGDNDD
jgi:hypothetical protein